LIRAAGERWRFCGALFVVLLDGTITIVALPSIGAGGTSG
jgi:hypothetical protein